MNAVTPDGSPVEFYRWLPAEPDLSVVRRHAEGRRRVLDLGAGAGRITNPLVLDGHDVVAVDQSAQMLQYITGARGVVSSIEELNLGEKFDLILLMSHLMNKPTVDGRVAVLASVAKHLDASGLVLAQRLDPEKDIEPGESEIGDVRLSLHSVDKSDWPRVRGVSRYSLGDTSWEQRWTMEVLDDAATAAAFATVGLTVQSTDGPWVVATR